MSSATVREALTFTEVGYANCCLMGFQERPAIWQTCEDLASPWNHLRSQCSRTPVVEGWIVLPRAPQTPELSGYWVATARPLFRCLEPVSSWPTVASSSLHSGRTTSGRMYTVQLTGVPPATRRAVSCLQMFRSEQVRQQKASYGSEFSMSPMRSLDQYF